jgi:xanthine dehydrogenase accessory factor
VEVAEEVLRTGEPQLLHFGIADEEAWDVGLPCGGEIDVWVERYEA